MRVAADARELLQDPALLGGNRRGDLHVDPDELVPVAPGMATLLEYHCSVMGGAPVTDPLKVTNAFSFVVTLTG